MPSGSVVHSVDSATSRTASEAQVWLTGSTTFAAFLPIESSLSGLAATAFFAVGSTSVAPAQTRIGTPSASVQSAAAVPIESVPAFTAISSAMPVWSPTSARLPM